jgi:hypothetical protein
VIVKRGADVASDHHLVTAKIKLKLKENWNEKERRKSRFNVNFLRDEKTHRDFRLTLANKFQILQELLDDENDTSIEHYWKECKETVVETCEQILGR